MAVTEYFSLFIEFNKLTLWIFAGVFSAKICKATFQLIKQILTSIETSKSSRSAVLT